MDKAYEALAKAIVLQAIEDWRTCVRHEANPPLRDRDTISSTTELRMFFNSDYGYQLCSLLDVDSKQLLSLLDSHQNRFLQKRETESLRIGA